MEPTKKIDNQFREKLAEREIVPSKNTWDRLDAMLSVAEKPKKSYGWLYIAASVVGFLLIGTIFFRNSGEMIDKGSDGVVFVYPADSLDNSQQVQTQEQGAVADDDAGIAIPSKKMIHAVTSENVSRHGSNENVAQIETSVDVYDQDVEQPTIINQKTEQTEMTKKPAYINAEELLASVEGTAKSPVALKGNAGIRVNPESLLSQVDGELEMSFREKVIKGVSKNFQTVKVALANRNKE